MAVVLYATLSVCMHEVAQVLCRRSRNARWSSHALAEYRPRVQSPLRPCQLVRGDVSPRPSGARYDEGDVNLPSGSDDDGGTQSTRDRSPGDDDDGGDRSPDSDLRGFISDSEPILSKHRRDAAQAGRDIAQGRSDCGPDFWRGGDVDEDGDGDRSPGSDSRGDVIQASALPRNSHLPSKESLPPVRTLFL